MDSNKKVFSSGIARANNKLNNDLYELLRIDPAKSLPHQVQNTSDCNFLPRCDKYYVPKNKLKLKVRTVRCIREQFERDFYIDLYSELDKQRTVLLRKIRIGSAREECTKKIAKSIICNDFPVSKDVWDMVMNLNPLGHTFSSQYVLWNGKPIQINGSKGGKNKFIFKHDLGKIQLNTYKPVTKRNVICNKKRLLQNSLHSKFKPGPLSKKKCLDVSYQKYQYGQANIISLPRPALDIQPLYGAGLESQMSAFLSETFMHNSEGKITKEWADFSVSVLGKNNNGRPVQTNNDGQITFNLQYKCNQNRLLMRNPLEHENTDNDNFKHHLKEHNDLSLDVKDIVSKMLDFVELNVEYSSIVYKIENQEMTSNDSNFKLNETSKDRSKRKFGELDRLDVTIIKLPGTRYHTTKLCRKSYCSLGCICDSLECPYTLKTHCGRVECMFNCQCAFSKSISAIPLLSGFIDLDNKMNNPNLAREEQKFRQTVVLSNEGSIVLNSQRRDWKASKKYADFYSKMCLKSEKKLKKNVSIVLLKLNCSEIEPWCMVHNLYKCFCKGKFTERALSELEEIKPLEEIKSSEIVTNNEQKENVIITNESMKSRLRMRSKNQDELQEDNIKTKITVSDEVVSQVCSRVESYKGRKFSNSYYSHTNKKIIEMEQNDRTLLKKLLSLIHGSSEQEIDEKEVHILEDSQPPTILKELLHNVVQNDIESTSKEKPESSVNLSSVPAKRLPNRTKLVAWLEANYKQYKERTEQGLATMSLDPPKLGKVALYPWGFILSRYRERKNLFLITKQKPYRILMAVNIKNPIFESCMNINNIKLTDLDDYPITVKNLLTNASDLKDNFCILCGLMECWELVGSVTKVNEMKPCDEKSNTFNCDNMTFDSDNETFCNSASLLDGEDSQGQKSTENIIKDGDIVQESSSVPKIPIDSELSKWFVMTIENDFNEIHFYTKGFFVKYESVIKAIKVSRVSGKTVRLSTQKCSNPQTGPQFGIYAIPNESDLNVFIGPYEKHELLGIETVKTTLPRGNTRKTRGSWIMVNKIDNVKIIDQPLAFLPSTYGKNEIISLESEIHSPQDIVTAIQPFCNTQKIISQEKTQTVKPLKICKVVPPVALPEPNSSSNEGAMTGVVTNEIKKVITTNKPIAEIAPQVKDEKLTNPDGRPSTSSERGMFVLKPEEINKRSLLRESRCADKNYESSDSMDMDVENFLATSDVCKFPSTDIFVISDDEDEDTDPIKNVYIQATNIENLGWIAAKRNASNNDISFEFPGFKFTEFYSKQEAFRKLNLVFSRKVFVPKNLYIQWEVVEDQRSLRYPYKLQSRHLRPELVMTKKGLKDRRHLMRVMKMKKRLIESEPNSEEFVKRRKLLMNIEGGESGKLLSKPFNKKVIIFNNMSEANEVLRNGMVERLNSILSDSDSV